MDEHQVRHLFERYYRGTATDAPAGGTGLGMAIVKQVMTAHQGTIAVESEAGRGTTITIRLPLMGWAHKPIKLGLDGSL